MVNIVVIGDSIAKGVGSTDSKTKNFGALVGEKVHGKVTNLGITGLDSSQLVEKLQTEKFENAIEEADVIFISIGSNDLLKPFLGTIADAAGVTGSSKELYAGLQKQFSNMSKKDPLKAGDVLATAVKRLNNNKKLQEACSRFPKNLDKIITGIREQNPDALIYVNNIYNPYYGVVYEYKGLTLLNIHDLCEKYIVKLNQAFDNNSKEYKLLDMYSIFRQEGYTNVNPASLENMSGVNFDPHPNDAGYQLMADYIYTQMDSTMPEAELVFEVNEEKIPADVEKITLILNEKVRPVAGRQIRLEGNGETYTYVLTGEEEPEDLENGGVMFSIPTENFLGDKQELDYDTEYTVTMEQGAFKDKGNNSPEKLEAGFFITQEEWDREANSTAVVNQTVSQEDTQAHRIMGISAAVFVLIAVAILAWMVYNQRSRKIKEEKEDEHEQD